LTGGALSASVSSAPGSPVSPSASPGRTEERTTSETCGPRPTVPFASWDPATSSWKTSQASLLTGTLAEYSETWPKAGTMRSGTLLRLRKSEHRTAANASSSWPTPDSNTSTYSNHHGGFVNLREKASEWPTPAASWFERGQTSPEVWEQRQKERTERGELPFATPLHVEAALWDTPKASSDKGGPNQRDGQGRPYLDAQARQWPTPTASDIFPYTEAEARRRSPDLPTTASRQAPTIEQPGHECSPKCRRLNPLFVEWLMGFPIGDTALERSATRSCPRREPTPSARFGKG
jgi:hypothetical protein